tara:strand:- start:321 stop:1064 length:744 start_codon:yes stop_codon:yes gene_type:complete
MPDSLGHRLKIGTIVPSTNTIVQPEFASMQPYGVTTHLSRIVTPNVSLTSDEDFKAHVLRMREGMNEAIERVMTSSPNCLANGLSLEAFWDGLDGSLEMVNSIEKKFGIKCSMGNNAILKALKILDVKKIAIITPHKPMGDEKVKSFFTEAGFNIADLLSFNINKPVEICHVSNSKLQNAIIKLNKKNPDAIVQVGTGLSMAKLAGEAWNWLNKPVIAINTSIFWHALRENKILDKIEGFGPLLEKY